MPQNSTNLEIVLPPQPSILVNIQQEISKDDPDLAYVAQQIAGDIALSVVLLRTVNSPFYGLRNKVCSVTDAVNLIGLPRTLNLVTAVSVRNSVPLPKGLEYFWDDTTKAAVMGASIARYLKFNADLAYLMGLFHNAAVPLIAAKYPDYLSSLAEFHCDKLEIPKAEDAKYNINHPMLGSLLARAWYLPSSLIQAISLHHNHDLFAIGLDNDILNLVSVCLLADNIAGRLNHDMDAHFPLLEGKIREYLNLLDDTHYQAVIDTALDSINQA